MLAYKLSKTICLLNQQKVYLAQMDSKIVPFKQKEKPSLTRLMIVALVEATVKQNQGILFGPADIKGGSFTPLINRGLIVHKEVKTKNHSVSAWQVTPEAIDILKSMGVDVVS